MKKFDVSIFHWEANKFTNHEVMAETAKEAEAKAQTLPEFGNDALILYARAQPTKKSDPWGNGGLMPFDVGFFNPSEKRL